ncbi:MAG: FAD-dependent oxidoreductase [Alphaproteobacteria bacterium]|jgi:3-(3-hydroxy-phenyl)propionate hydroxylase|nr:FAD-dependent oxidoreductase [Alphaproteobacteria bacterium]
MGSYINPVYPYRRPPELDRASTMRHPVVIVGAGPVGLTAALDLALRGQQVIVLDEDNTVSVGSRAICWAQRTLEIWDRLGVAQRMLDKGVLWDTGKLYVGERLIYQFQMQSQAHQRFPAFINLQQYYVEQYLVERCADFPAIDLRWKNKLVGIEQDGDEVRLKIETPDGVYGLAAQYVIAADGVRSPVRSMMGLSFDGQVFNDRFLIADVRMTAEFPSERWFWFDPPFHRGQSVLLHRQADEVFRIDFQLGPNADPDVEKQLDRVTPRLKAMLGERQFDYEWVSVYSFSCRCMESFNHGRVFFAGDAAHVVSPFGARGGNSGVQDADNLVWKLDLVLRNQAPSALLETYSQERVPAAREHIHHSTRSTDFITPRNDASRVLRDAVLSLAADYPFARALINSGRLSQASRYEATPLATADERAWSGGAAPGAPAPDGPLGNRWLFDGAGERFRLLAFEAKVAGEPGLETIAIGKDDDHTGVLWQRYDAQPGTVYLLRPDRHVAARWRRYDAQAVRTALRRAMAA